MQKLLQHIATLGFIGYLPFAPGTWASFAGLAVSWITLPSTSQLALMILFCTIAGVISATAAEKAFGEKDSSRIVIDELAGFLVATFMVPATPGYLTACFFLFRFFDILKPFPVRLIERTLKGGTGVVADDIAAGIYANIIVQAWIRIAGNS